MVVNARSSRKLVKRRVTAELSDFLTFPTSGDFESPEATRPFRANIRGFLSKHALFRPPSSLFPHLVAWQIPFRVGDLVGDDGVVCLDVVEEDVSRSRSPYCDQCRVVGWSGNPVSTKRYHFIIKADGDSISGCNKPCAGCGDSLHMADPRCKSCNHLMTAEDVEDWMYQELECTTHLLHGVIHANGYGHLLRVNGREGGSRILLGRNIMNFWDRLCSILGVREVSVMDVSKKNGLEFRLLHAVVYGNPWYGEWGYKFGAGSFSLTIDDYNAAVVYLSSLPLLSLPSDGRKLRTELQDRISFYQSISDHQLTTNRDLFSFLMSLIQERHESLFRDDVSPRKKLKICPSEASTSWSSDDEHRVEDALFKVLRAVSGSSWVSWRALKGAVCRAGSPDLVNYCLKELKGKQAAPGLVVCSRVIDGGGLEYRIEPGIAHVQAKTVPVTSSLSEERLLRDLKYFYECMLHPGTMVSRVSLAASNPLVIAAQKILDCKHFVKDYCAGNFLFDSKENSVRVLCEVDLMEQQHGEEVCHNPPPELLLLSPDATIADLKLEATKAFQDVYLMFRRFQALEVVGYSGVDESTQLKLLLGSSGFVRIRGKFAGKNGLGRYRMERGVERWVVDCSCGAKDDDGERMLACDGCSTWFHTRCSGIPDSDGVPGKFLCHRCVISTNDSIGSGTNSGIGNWWG